MPETLALYLPFPPSSNTYYRNICIGGYSRTLISKKGRKYRKEVQALVRTKKILSGELIVRLTLVPPDKRRRDIDNFNKAMFDALTHSRVWHDDCQIKSLCIDMNAPNKLNPHVAVVISEIENG